MRAKVRVGSRGSRLALVQTGSVVRKIKELNPDLDIEIRKITTSGDRDRITRLDRIGVAVFVKELEEALLDGRIDLVVHSLKDVPTGLPEGLCLLGVTERLDPRDALVAGARLGELPPGAKIGTDSLRRSVQLARCRPDLQVSGIRGNVDTRLRKVASGEYDGVIVAAAAMLRLGRADQITEYLDTGRFLPSVGQGALVVEARADDTEMAELMAPLNHVPAWQGVLAERAFLSTVGGGCRAPIAALGTVANGRLKLEGMVAGVKSGKLLRAVEEGNAGAPEVVGQKLASKLIEAGAAALIDEVKGG